MQETSIDELFSHIEPDDQKVINKFEKIVNKESNNPEYSFCVIFSKYWCLEKWLKNFENIELDQEFTELVFIVDIPGDNYVNLISKWVESIKDKFNGCKILVNKTKKRDIKLTKNKSSQLKYIISNWVRFISNWEEFKKNINGKFVFSCSDDVIPESDCYKRLLEILVRKKAGFVQATGLLRNNFRIIPNWYINKNSYGQINKIISAQWPLEFTETYIDAGTMNCFVAPTPVVMTTPLEYSEVPLTGPDFHFSLYITQDLELPGFTDWNIKYSLIDHETGNLVHLNDKIDIEQLIWILGLDNSWRNTTVSYSSYSVFKKMSQEQKELVIKKPSQVLLTEQYPLDHRFKLIAIKEWIDCSDHPKCHVVPGLEIEVDTIRTQQLLSWGWAKIKE